jgi:cyclopropane fatty-acyl-phospholipid synthase-like methyltransferase
MHGERKMDHQKETFDTWNKVASLYQEKFMDLDLYDETYDFICRSIVKQNARVLEIGCGPGNITRYLLSCRPDFDILGIDVAPNMIELARTNNPSAQFAVMDCRHISSLDKGYDGIIGGFCLPYLSQAEAGDLISSSRDLLNDEGLIYLSFVEGNPSQSEFKTGSHGRVFFHYHDLEVLKLQLKDAGFGDMEVFRVNYKTSDTDFDVHTILLAKLIV